MYGRSTGSSGTIPAIASFRFSSLFTPCAFPTRCPSTVTSSIEIALLAYLALSAPWAKSSA
jgi:hypothetical protein